MTINYSGNINFLGKSPSRDEEKLDAGIFTKPIETVQKTIETGVDTFVQTIDPNESEEKKKTRKKAIAISSAVLVIAKV